ncbi:MAG: hypothetical protein JWP36_2453 [Paucimonas sp.]|nr:hypothetical protein [Paucimonas sp.]
MSLINQMLQDLEAGAGDKAAATTLPEEVQAAMPAARDRRPLLFAALALAGLAAMGFVGWQRYGAPVLVQNRPADIPPELSLKISAALLPMEMTLDAKPLPMEGAASGAEAVAGPAAPAFAPQAMGKPPFPAAVAEADPRNRAGATPPVTGPEGGAGAGARSRSEPRTEAAAPAGREAAAADTSTRDSGARSPAENEYRRGLELGRQNRPADAIAAFERALQLDRGLLPARQALATQLVEAKRFDEASGHLQEWLAENRANGSWAMMLARIQLDRGETRAAIDTLSRTLPYDRERPDYQAFMAALLQKEGRHREAVDYYLTALRRAPQNAAWWMGLGISLQADSRPGEARDAFTRAQSAGGLSTDLQAFVQQRLDQLR